MKKRLLAFLLAVVMVVGMAPAAGAAAPTSGKCGENVTWSLQNGTLTISGTGKMWGYDLISSTNSNAPWSSQRYQIKTVVINHGVTSIGVYAFFKFTGLTSVTIPDSVTSIDRRAFWCCENLKDITIPNSVTSIGDYAFFGCKGLTSMVIPSSVTKIEEATFMGCEGLTNITIPNSVTVIGEEAFHSCHNLASISIPGSVTSIAKAAFCNCTSLTSVVFPHGVTTLGVDLFGFCENLTSVTIPDSVTSIGSDAFGICPKLTAIIVSENNKYYASQDGVLFSKDMTEIICYPAGKDPSYVIPDGVTTINAAFAWTGRMTSVAIPTSVTAIRNDAFLHCGAKDIYYAGTEAQWNAIEIEEYAFSTGLPTIHFNSTGNDPEGVSKITIDGKSIQSLFSKSSFEYDNDLALFAANLSSAVEDETGEGINNYFNSLGWPDEDREIYQYGGDRAFSIACARLSKDENLLVITARGSQTPSEFFEDAMSFGTRDFFGYTTNDVIYDFERDIMAALNGELETQTEGFLDSHEYLMEQPLKILITGHSLGGAAANLNAARFTLFEDSGAWWSDLTEQSDIYCYTFGAINSLSDNLTRKDGFENIHNVYNLYDSFSPYCLGKWLPSGLGRGYGKFGHMDTYAYDYAKEVKRPPVYHNHLMVNYIDSLAKRYVSCKVNARLSAYSGAVLCPVDLKIYLETTDGPVLAGSITDNKIDEIEHPMVGLRVDGDKKYFYLPDNENYTIRLKGTGSGTMTYLIREMDPETGEAIPGTETEFQNVSLMPGKQFSSEVQTGQETAAGTEVELYVLGADGQPEKEVLPDGKGTEIAYVPKVHFTDVPADAYYHDAVYWAVANDIVKGTSPTTFSPEETCTQPQILTLLWRAAGEPESKATIPFTVNKGLEYTEGALRWALEKGMIDKSFDQTAPCTRASAVKYIWQAAGSPNAPAAKQFTDVPAGADYAAAVGWAVSKGVVEGTSPTTFSPSETCTRAQIVTLLYRDRTDKT